MPTFNFNKSATNAVIRTLLQPTFVGGARTLAQHQSARFIFWIGPTGVKSRCANSRRLLAVRAHYPITRIKSAVGPTANKSCIVYGGLKAIALLWKHALWRHTCVIASFFSSKIKEGKNTRGHNITTRWWRNKVDWMLESIHFARGPPMYGMKYQLIVYMLVVLMCSTTE